MRLVFIALEFALFVASTAIFFKKRFEEQATATLLAGTVALMSTALLSIELYKLYREWTSATAPSPAPQQKPNPLPVPAPTPLPTPSPPVPMPADEIFWLTIRDSEARSLFEEFLTRFPNSPRAREARAKLAVLRPTAPPPAPDEALWQTVKGYKFSLDA